MKPEMKKLIIANLPYLLFVYLFGKLGQTYRLAAGADLSEKLLHLADGFSLAFESAAPSFHLFDLAVGVAGAVALRLMVYCKSKNAKKYRRGVEYGSARWGGPKDIAPYIDPVFDNNILLTQTERLTMNNRPKDPKTARNKNVLVIGGSGSGKTRFFVKPNLMRVMDVRARHVKGCMDEGVATVRGKEQHASASMKNKIKSLFNLMLDYALEYEIVDRNYSRTFKLTDETIKEIQKVKKEHIPFTDEEISKLWEHVDDKNFVDVILIQCYSGWRPQELGLIELANVDLENGTFKGGIKTEAGEDRVVPIHSKIRYLVERHYNKAKEIGSPYLFNCKDKRSGKTVMMSYQRYKAGFEMIRDELNLNPEHRPHDGRKHFVTAAKKAGIDEYAIKYMVGHKISDITEKVYTQREFDWLKEEIEKIK